MTFITLFVLLIINFCWFYIYLAVQFTQEQLNGWLWSWLQIGFEPSDFIGVMLAVALAAQLLLLVIIYGYNAHGRRLRNKFSSLRSKNKELQQERKSNQQVLKEQSHNLAQAATIEEKNTILEQQVQTLSSDRQSLESELNRVAKENQQLINKLPVAKEGNGNLPNWLQKSIDAVKNIGK